MEKNLKVRFKQRTDTAANWAAKNPVLLQGEFGCESDTGNLKFGDGTKAWNDLSYVKEKLAKVATSGSYNDLSNKPTIPTVPGSLKNPYALTFTGGASGSYDGSAAKSVAIPVVDSALSSTSTNTIQNKVVNAALGNKANKATTLAGYGITDAKISSGVITIGNNTITPLTSHQSLAAYAKTTDVNTALAKKADKATVLTNQDLNNVKTDGDYYAGGDNTITNKPSGIDAFGLTVYHTANGYITQDLVEGNTNPQKRYTRQFDAQNWSAWIAMPTFTTTPVNGQVLISDGTLGGIKTSGYTIASNVPANAKFTDTNTWRGIQNVLTSDSTTESLSAAQGKALKTLVDGKAAKATTLSGYGITDAKITNGVITLGSNTITPLTAHQSLSAYAKTADMNTALAKKADKGTTLSAYGITDAKISGGVITLGSNTITPLTSHQSLANYYTKSSVDTLISNLKAGLVNVVDSLPTTGENGKLYLVKTGTEDKNLYTEYVYVNSAWEKLGTQKLDLSGYLTKTDASNTYLGKTAAAASANKLNTNAGSATQPVYFANGVPVATTYTLGKSVPSNAVFTDTNNKVTQTAVTDADYTNYRPLIWGASNSGTKGFTPATVTDSLFASTGLYVQPSSGLIHATTFEGNLTGTASNASKVNNLTVLTAVPANAKFTDTNTWRGIQNNLTSDSTTDSLSAAQGKVLKGLVDGKAASNHTHNYLIGYSQGKRLTSANLTTNTNGAGAMFSFVATSTMTEGKPPVDSQILQMNWDGNNGFDSQLAIKNTGERAWIRGQNSGTWGDWRALVTSSKDSAVGNSTTPTYVSADGKITACSYTLGKSVPSDAKFTDTVYTLPDATSSVKGGVKVGSNLTVSSGTLSLTKTNVTAALGYTPPATNTDTHYTTGLKVGASSTATANAAATNGNVYLNVLDNTTVRDSHNIVGSGATTVTSDANGKITISSTNTVYSHPSTHPASMITGLATVATSGSYSDLSDKPTIPTIPSSLPANGGTATNANNVAINKTNPTTATTYYVPFAANNTGTLPIRGNDGFRYYTLEGTTSAVGQSQLGLGNNIASGTAGNKAGKLYMYGTGTGYTTLTTANTSSNSYTATLPAKNGTVAMTSDIPTIPTSLPANGGTATSANKLNTNAGSATQPVYFTNGVPTACTYTLGASVPSGAKFTDTNTWRGIQNNLTSDSTTDSLSAAQGKVLKGLVDGKAASNHTHSYLPLSGGTLTGSVVGKTTGGSWISGMTVSNLSLYCSQMNKDSYWPFIGGKTYSSNVWNLGGLGDNFGFYVFKSGRTENSTDYRVTINTNTGVLSSSAGFSGSLSGNATSATKATQDSAGQQINTTYIKGLSVSGKTITYTKGDGSTGTITTQDTNTTYGAASSSTLGLVKTGSNITNSSGTISITKDNVVAALGYTPPTTNTTYSNMTAATASAAGKAGLVPAPAAGKQTSFLRGDGTWVVPTNTTYSNMKGATSSAAGSAGLVPAPATGAQGLYLRGDGTWATPTNTTYSAATASALGLVKVGSNITVSSGTISLTKANVTAALGYTPPTTNTTYSNMTAATASAAGKAGLVPAPAAGAQAKFLRGDGTWQNVDTSSAKVKMVVY